MNENIVGDKTIIVTKRPLCFFDECISVCSCSKLVSNAEIKSLIPDNVVIGNNVRIGENCKIHPYAVIHDNVIIGNNVTIQSHTVVGSLPFSYIRDKNKVLYARKVWGNTIIEDDVEIGADCTIDKGITSDTIVGENSKMDNMVHIGHDVKIGKNCLFSAQVGIAGYVQIKDNCSFWGKSCVSNRITIASGSNVLGGSIVTKDIKKENLTVCGFPAQKSIEYWKKEAIKDFMIQNYQKNNEYNNN